MIFSRRKLVKKLSEGLRDMEVLKQRKTRKGYKKRNVIRLLKECDVRNLQRGTHIQ
jgi:hypothetical protein